MPRKKTYCLLSLKESCLSRIARDMESFWFASFHQQWKDTPRLLHILGPFDHVTSELIQCIIDTLASLNLFRAKYLQMFLCSRLLELNLDKVKQYISGNNTASLIGGRCQNLMKLNIACCNTLSAKSLKEMILLLPRLQHLNMSNTKCDNKVMEAIGHTCNELVTLNVSNSSVTEKGLEHLCLRSNHSSQPCPKLRAININGITSTGHKTIAKFVAKRTNLVDFVYHDICSVIEYFCEKGYFAEGGDIGPNGLKIVTLTMDLGLVDPDRIDTSLLNTLTYCKQLTQVELTRVSDYHNLLPLVHAANMTKVTVEMTSSNENSFRKGMLPVLEIIGNRLKYLGLITMNKINFEQVGSLCPQLEQLYIVTNTWSRSAEIPVELQSTIFQSLKSVSILIVGREEPGLNQYFEMFLRYLFLNARHIEKISMDGCDELLDSILIDANDSHSFHYLLELNLNNCNSVTANSITRLLTTDNDMSQLHLINCWNISRQNFEHFKQLVNFNDYDLKIIWD